jgi:hypothetical protein
MITYSEEDISTSNITIEQYQPEVDDHSMDYSKEVMGSKAEIARSNEEIEIQNSVEELEVMDDASVEKLEVMDDASIEKLELMDDASVEKLEVMDDASTYESDHYWTPEEIEEYSETQTHTHTSHNISTHAFAGFIFKH